MIYLSDKSVVAQVSKPAVSPISKSARSAQVQRVWKRYARKREMSLKNAFGFILKLTCVAIASPVFAAGLASAGSSRSTINFDQNWRFLKGDVDGAEKLEFADSAWRTLNVPHDWSIEGPFAETNQTGGSGAFLPAGVGWYRKTFTLGSNYVDRIVSVEFDGVMANGEVWINGHHLGKRPYGYVSFHYDLTPYVMFGAATNVLAVRADNSQQPASRWYSGAGIYRHVRLVVTDPVHVSEHGVFVSTKEIRPEGATVRVGLTLTNQFRSTGWAYVVNYILEPGQKLSDIDPKIRKSWLGTPMAPENHLHFKRTSPQDHSVATSAVLESGAVTNLSEEFFVQTPKLWDLEHPEMYRLVTRVYVTLGFTNHIGAADMIDEVITPFGIRDFQFKSDSGFWLNGKNFKLYGVCLHHDGSAFGAAVPLGVWERRLEALRQLGVNAIRTAHNPPAPEFLDLCDRMGFLVMDELFDCWTVGKNPYDYHLYFNDWSEIDARDTILRDRNHPSIVLYSVGNEIHDTPKADLAKSILQKLVAVCHTNDPTRPVTQALFRPNVSHDYDNGLADMLDVIGTNYRDNELLAAQRAKPERKIVGTEQRHDRQTWLNLRDNPSHSGQFLWTGIDYLGESRRWPIVAAGSGLLDRTAVPRSLGYERQSWWSAKPMVFITRRIERNADAPTDPGFDPLDRRQVLFPDWTPRSSEAHDENLEVYSNCQEVELFLNGRSLGSKPLSADASPRNWKVAFEPGVLKAVARNHGKVVASEELRSAGRSTKIVLSSDRSKLTPDWDEISCLTATVVDENGVVVPNANNLITFKVTGPGVVAAVDSADNSSHEPFQATERKAFQGRCVAFIKSTAEHGKITVTASAPGLKPASVGITAIPMVK
jgi:beta-galactosidase